VTWNREFPLLRKELRALLRTRRAFWFLAAGTAAAGLTTLCYWPRRGSAAGDWAAVFRAFAEVQLTAALLLVPAFTAGAFAGERERDTYDLLLAAPISTGEIVFGKAAASLTPELLLLAACAPILFAISLLGGVDFATVIRCQAITFGAIVLAGLIGLSTSFNAKSTPGAAAGGLARILQWTVWVPSAIWYFLPSSVSRSHFSPHLALILETSPGGSDLGGYLAFAFAIGALHYAFMVRRARPPGSRAWPAAGLPAPPPAPAGVRRNTRFTRAVLALAGGETPRLPFLAREVRAEIFGRSAFRHGVFWGCLAAAALLCVVEARDPLGHTWYQSGLGLILLLILGLGPAFLAGSFSREVERGNLDALRALPVQLGRVVEQKFFAGVYALSGAVGAGTLAVGFLGLSGIAGERAGGHAGLRCILIVLLLAATLLNVAALSTLASVVAGRTLGAMVTAYGGLAA
jgi:ABC-type transport system involved in multi-copper enzyme maturation permease subunit